MKASCLAVAFQLLVESAYSEGMVWFDNFVTGGVDAPFYDDRGRRLEGDAYLAQLYAWAPELGFQPIGIATPFKSNGYFDGREVRVPWPYAPGAAAWLQVRAWEAIGGDSFEQAALEDRWTGASEALYVVPLGTTYGPKGTLSLSATTQGGGEGSAGVFGPPLIPAYMFGLKYPGPPVIVRQPGSEAILAGQSAMLSVVAGSGVTATCQWYSDPGERPDGLIVNATNVTYTTPALGTNTTYWATVANVAGAVTSERATVTVLSQPPQLALQVVGGWPTLTLTGDPGVAYRVERAPAAAGPWVAVVEVTLARSPFTFFDPPGVGTDQRFYRAVAR